MHYYLYEIKNKVNNNIYIGVHKTKKLDDGYMGSGLILELAIKKYGIENFTKTILETFLTKEAMFSREKEIVNEEFLSRPDTYNLRRGGNGGFDYINNSGIKKFHGKKHSDVSKKIIGEKSKGRIPSDETKIKMSENSWSKKDPESQRKHASKVSRDRQINGKSEEEKQKISISLSKAHADGKFTYEYLYGNTNNRGKRWIHCGEETRMIPKEAPLPVGWEEKRK